MTIHHAMATPVNTVSSHSEFQIDTGAHILVNWTKIVSTSRFIKNHSYPIQDMDGLKNLCQRNASLKSCQRVAASRDVDTSNNPSVDSVINQEICSNFEDLSSLWNTQRPTIGKFINRTSQEIVMKRKKRSTPNGGASPCSTGLIEKVFVYLYSDDTQYELYHNIQNHLYQTFYVRDCSNSPPELSGHTCKPEYIKSKAAVFNPITDVIEVRNVFVPATCTYQAN